MSAAREVRVELPPDLGIEHAGALHALLAPHLGAAAVALSGAGVTRLHAAGLQLLASFIVTRAAAGHETRWHDPSPGLRGAAARLGLDTVLGLDGPARS